MGNLALKNLTLGYGKHKIIRNIDLDIQSGELVSLLGPSGSGKTTILKSIAGLLQPDSGDIFINGNSVVNLPAEKRDAVMVFQKPLLFPFLSVEENIRFGLKMNKVPLKNQTKLVSDILKLTKLTGLNTRKPNELSGGQQQRVSLARALVLKPSALLLDEPLSNLDYNLRVEMRDLIVNIQKETGITMLFVTHDQTEALVLSDRVVLLLDGRIYQQGTPGELFHSPRDERVARFFGGVNFLNGMVKNNCFCFSGFEIPMSNELKENREVKATIRPEDIELSLSLDPLKIASVIQKIHFEGEHTRIWVKINNLELVIQQNRRDLNVGQEVFIGLPSDKIHFF